MTFTQSSKRGLFSRLGNAVDLFRYKSYWAKRVGIAAIGQFDEYRAFMKAHVPAETPRLLEIGVGQLAYHTLLFHSAGYAITGIDIEAPTFRMSAASAFRILRREGLLRAAKSIVRHALFDRQYLREIEKVAPFDLSFDADIRIMDTTNLLFDNGTFDFVFSNAVFEHIADVDRAVSELNRVLSDRGIALINIHLFPSVSGGHLLEWELPDQEKIRRSVPWDHLRESVYQADVYLNRLRLADYERIFEENTKVTRTERVIEGEQFLTEPLRAELMAKGYTLDDLLTRTITFYCAKRRMS